MYVNLDILKTFAEDDPSFLTEMIDKFNAEMPQILNNLENALEKEDWQSLKQIAHKMIGTTGVFYITDVTPYLQKIEQECMKTPTKEELKPKVEKVRSICEAAMKELEAEKHSL